MANPYPKPDPDEQPEGWGGQAPTTLSDILRSREGGLPFTPQAGATVAAAPSTGLPITTKPEDTALEDFAAGLSKAGQYQGLPLTPTPAPTGIPGLGSPFTVNQPAGGMLQPLEQRLQDLMRVQDEYQKMSGWKQFFGGGRNADIATAQIKELLPQYRQLRQDDATRMEKASTFLKDATKEITDWQALPSVVQAQSRPALASSLMARGQLAGVTVNPALLDHMLSTEGAGALMGSLVNDPAISPERLMAHLQRIGRIAPGPNFDSTLAAIQKEEATLAEQQIRPQLRDIVTAYRQANSTPATVTAVNGADLIDWLVKTNPGVMQSPSKLAAINAIAKDADALAAAGIEPGSVRLDAMKAYAKAQVEGPKVTDTISSILASYQGPDGKPLTAATAAALPPGSTITDAKGQTFTVQSGAEVFARAKAQDFQNQLDISSNRGYAALLAKAAAERNVPLIQIEGMKNVHVVNKKTEQSVDRLLTNLDMLQKGGGEKNYAVMSEKSYDAFIAAKEADGILNEFLKIATVLTPTPGANWSQALIMYAKTKMGSDNPGVAFDALQGAVLRMARAMQGSSQALSDMDRKSVAGFLPQSTDTMQTALHRLEIAATIIQNMKDVQLGKMAPQTLLERIDEAKQDLVKTTGVDIYTNGSTTITVPRGSSHPGKGWNKVGGK